MNIPKKKTDVPDGIEDLEEMHKKMKEEQEAWRTLLENLGNLKKRSTDTPETEKPST